MELTKINISKLNKKLALTNLQKRANKIYSRSGHIHVFPLFVLGLKCILFNFFIYVFNRDDIAYV